MVSALVIGVSSLIATYVFLRALQTLTHGANEPPTLACEIPFISPLIGMAKKGKFYSTMRDKYNLPIYTLRLPGTRIYIVNSTKLIAATQRQIRTLDFAPIEAESAIHVTGATPAAQEILNMDRNGVGKYSYAIEFSKAIHPAMSPGAQLDAINASSVQLVAACLDEMASRTPQTLDLYEWVSREVGLATTDAVYGPDNPFRETDLLKDFWTLESGIMILILRLFPSILAKDSIASRERMVAAFKRYFAANGHERGSALIRARYDHSIDYNIGPEDMARFEVGGAFAILTNTVPTAFWVVWYLYSAPSVLADCRAELERICDIDGANVTLDITRVKHECSLLLSTLQEVLRFHGTGASARIVREDHLLDGEYFLKKGATLMIPAYVQHTSTEIYGDDVSEFKHARFVRGSGKPRPNPAGFRAFGGGSTLCPGRHFASTEIIAFAALLILKFDVEPVAGKWVRPTTNKAGMQATIPTPDTDVQVRITGRKDKWSGMKWNAILKGSDEALELVVEDVAEKH